MLDRSAILATLEGRSSACEIVEVPEWKAEVNVGVMSGARRDRFEASHSRDSVTNVRGRIAAFTLCDDQGKFLFEEVDAEMLGELDWRALDRIFDVAVRINALSKDAIEDLAKNSVAVHSECMPLASLNDSE